MTVENLSKKGVGIGLKYVNWQIVRLLENASIVNQFFSRSKKNIIKNVFSRKIYAEYETK